MPYCLKIASINLQNTLIPLKLSSLLSDRGSSPLSQLLSVNISSSLHTLSFFLELYQMPSEYSQNPYTTFSSYLSICAYFSRQAVLLSILCLTQKPNCIASAFTISQILLYSTVTAIFIACSKSFAPCMPYSFLRLLFL